MKTYPSNLIGKIVEGQLRINVTKLKLGDTIHVSAKTQDGNKQRVQFYLGVLSTKKGVNTKETRTIESGFNGGIVAERVSYRNAKSIEYNVI